MIYMFASEQSMIEEMIMKLKANFEVRVSMKVDHFSGISIDYEGKMAKLPN